MVSEDKRTKWPSWHFTALRVPGPEITTRVSLLKSAADVVKCTDVDYATGSFCSSCSIPPPITGGLWSTGSGVFPLLPGSYLIGIPIGDPGGSGVPSLSFSAPLS